MTRRPGGGDVIDFETRKAAMIEADERSRRAAVTNGVCVLVIDGRVSITLERRVATLSPGSTRFLGKLLLTLADEADRQAASEEKP